MFARIAGDHRHHQVRVLSRGIELTRRFADWRMAFAKAHTREFYWLTTFLEAHHHHLLLPQIPVAEPRMATLLARFNSLR